MNDRVQVGRGTRVEQQLGDAESMVPQRSAPGKTTLTSQLAQESEAASPATGKGLPHGAPIAGKDDDGGQEAAASPPQLRMTVSAVRSSDGAVLAGPPVTGLGKTTVSGPTGLKSGSFSWVIQWVLDKPSPKGGCIVQGVETAFDVKDSADKAVDVKATTGVNPGNWPLWELWEVNKGQKVTTYAETGDTADDTYGMPEMGAKTKGSITIKGTAEFYEGLAKPASFKVTPGSPAGILPIVRSKPTLSGGTGAISHDLTATWDSTGSNDKTTIAVV